MSEEKITIGSRTVDISNPEKVLYPDVEYTKGDVIEYYRRIAPVMLPHISGYPIVLKRYPDGVEEDFFYERRCPPGRPSWLSTQEVPTQAEKPIISCIVNDEASLIWLANLASIEVHTMLYQSDSVGIPDKVVFDLDPGAPADILDCVWVALRMRDVLSNMGLECYPKTSGGKGIHLYIPLNVETDFTRTRAFARTLARNFERKYPERVTDNMRKSERKGKVFIDWNQNSEHKTTVAAYSLRARPRPTVSTPLTWEELEHVQRNKDRDALVFVADDVVSRVEEYGDLFEEVLTVRQELP